jgi:UDP-N-acetylglucosamine:LPS N-acetylglucosamine transferase
MLFSCSYGSGHKMATQGISQSLKDYNIKIVDIYDEPLRFLDPMKDFLPNLSLENIFNKLAKKEHNHVLNMAGNLGKKTFYLQKRKIEKTLFDYIEKENPEMLISCIPLVNPLLFNVAKQLDIPFLVVTTDIDISAFCYGFKNDKIDVDKSKFAITAAYEKKDYNAFKMDINKNIEPFLAYNFGYPTRDAFSQPIEKSTLNQIRNQYHIQADENVILIMMGSNGSLVSQHYAKHLLSMSDIEISQIVGIKNKIRVICLCGDIQKKENRFLMYRLNAQNQYRHRKNNKVHIFAAPGTDKIAEIVSLPELFTVISKPGGSTVNEMIKKRVPMIYHISKVTLDWEKGNMLFGESKNLGSHFKIKKINKKTNRKELIKVLKDNFELNRAIQNGEKTIVESEINFSENLRSKVKKMLK